MPKMHYNSIQKVITYLSKNKRKSHLLLGNGFSIAYSKNIFSYKALYEFVSHNDSDILKPLFESIKTQNFEQIMRDLDNCIKLLIAFGGDTLSEKLFLASETLKESLIDAIRQMHPAHVFHLSEQQSGACASFFNHFLSSGGSIYTTNYDLLMYWVIMRNLSKLQHACDGFGNGECLNPDEVELGEEAEYADLHWGPNKNKQNIHYVHGGLPLFDDGFDIIKEKYSSDSGYLLENINKRIKEGQYPIFVTAGDGEQKLNHIAHNRYLSFCYESLCDVDGSIVTFGFSFGQYDHHIIDALNRATPRIKSAPKGLRSIYIGCFSDDDIEYINSISHKFKAKVNTFDASTANIWGD